MTETASKTVSVAFLGPLGTFSHDAVIRYFGELVRNLDVTTIDDVFAEVEAGHASYGVVPVENSTEGAVNNTQDCLIQTSLIIVAEVVVPIEHNLLVRHDADPARIDRIVSHKQSLAQCRQWLKTNWPATDRQEVNSNAEAARLASVDPGTAAIAGDMAARYYDLKIQSRRIQDQKNNSTRFLVLSKSGEQSSEPSTNQRNGRFRTSIIVYAENRPGSLFRILEPFERNQISLTKIETRPAPDSIWAYVFFIDFEGHEDDPAVTDVFAQLQDRTVRIKKLGSYPMAQS